MLSVLWISIQSTAQIEIIEKVFASRPTNFRSEIEIIDTIAFFYVYDVEGGATTYNLDETTFGTEDFKFFLVYRHKTLNKCGLIIYDEKASHFTEPVCDSIYFIKAKDYVFTEGYNPDGSYSSTYKASKLNFIFGYKDKKSELWEIGFADANYYSKKIGEVEREIFKAVTFSEITVDEYYTTVYGVFANLRTNEIVSSAILNTELVALEAYAYHYDYYEYEYDSYSEEGDVITAPTFESRLLYSPVEIIYIKSGDTISELVNYSYVEVSDKAAKNKVVPDNFNGVWKTAEGAPEEPLYLMIEGDDVLTDLGIYAFTVDTYDETFEVATLNWGDMLKRLNLPANDLQKFESIWQGPRTEVDFIGTTSWNQMSRFKDFIIQNDENLVHIYFDVDIENKVVVGMQTYYPQKVYSDFVTAYYDELLYTTIYKNGKEEIYDLNSTNPEYSFYNYTISVAEKNINKEGDLILTDESLGSVKIKSYSTGNYSVGKIKISWIGNEKFNESSKIVSSESMPFKILDEANNVLVDDVSSLYLDNVQGLSLFVITDSDLKTGILGPDGKWLVKKEYETINILSPSVSYTEYYSSVRNFPVFFAIYQNGKCGLLDSKGSLAVPIEFDYIEACKNNIITVKNGLMGIYTFDGKKILDNEYLIQGYYGLATDCYSLDIYGDGAKVLSKNSLSGIVDKDFNVLVPFEYTSLTTTTDTKIFIAVNQDGKVGLINSQNEEIVEFEYDFISPFEYYPNRFVVGRDQKQGAIDVEGNILIPIEHFAIQPSSDWGSNIILTYNEYYMTNAIDTMGRSIIESGCYYLYYYPAHEIISCGNDVTFNFYDRSGNLLYSKISSNIDPYNAYDNIQVAPNWNGTQEDPIYGAFDLLTGAELMPYEFESLYPIWIDTQMYFVGTKNGKIGIYSMSGEELVKPKGTYLDNYFYEYLEDGSIGYYVEISNKKGKSKIIQLPEQ